MKAGAIVSFGARLRALREAAGFTQEELATIAGLSVHAISALERGERRRPQPATVRALAAALDLTAATRDALVESARPGPPAADRPGGAVLPLPPTTLLGREADMRTARRLLDDPAVRLLTLTGPGGAGKTRLALELARAIAAEDAVRVVFVSLAAVRDLAGVAREIAEALGLADVTTRDLALRARAACDGHATLLVLDNFEQVLDAAPLAADLLTMVAPLRILVTSRAPLHVRGEREYAVGPLALEETLDAISFGDQAGAPAVRLFAERVRDVRPDFQLTAANTPVVTDICRRLDALPLALELAAPWMKTLTPEELLRRLAHDVLLPAAGPRDLPERQRTMNATVAWSYQRLEPHERCAFRRLGALPGRFSIEAAAAALSSCDQTPVASSDALRAVAGLIDRSLLLRADATSARRPMYQMLETVRAYAALELAAAGERESAMEGLVRHSTAEAALAADSLGGPAQIDGLDRVRDDLEIHRGALAWLLEHGRGTEAAGIAWGLMFFWVIRGHAAEGHRWFQRALAAPSLTPAAEASARLGLATMWYTQGELDSARGGLMRAQALAESVGDRRLIVQAENMLGHVEHAVGHVDAARDRFTRSVEGFRALGLPWGIGNAMSGLAWGALAAGDFARGEQLLDEAAVVLRQAGPWFLSLASYVRAILAVRRGDANRAIALSRENLGRLRELHDTFVVVYALVPLASAAVLKGDDVWAARILGVRDAITDRTGATVVDKSVLDLRDQAERGVRLRLGPKGWDRAYGAGRRASVRELLAEIDEARPAPAREGEPDSHAFAGGNRATHAIRH